jgi:hypothetical protein
MANAPPAISREAAPLLDDEEADVEAPLPVADAKPVWTAVLELEPVAVALATPEVAGAVPYVVVDP